MTMLETPAFVFGLLLVTAYALAFYIFLAKRSVGILYLWLVSLFAFGGGQLLARYFHPLAWMLGDIYVVEASLICLLALLVANWLRL